LAFLYAGWSSVFNYFHYSLKVPKVLVCIERVLLDPHTKPPLSESSAFVMSTSET